VVANNPVIRVPSLRRRLALCASHVFWAFLLGALTIFIAACEGKNPPPSQKEQAKEREQSRARLKEQILRAIKEFQEVYGANANWNEAFTRQPVWTIDVQARLIAGGPIIGTGYVDDVEYGEEHLIHFKRGMMDDIPASLGVGGISVDFKLRCEAFNDHRPDSKRAADQVKRDYSGGWHDTHVFVAKIHSVERTHKPNPRDNDVDRIQPRRFTATGECLAIRYVGD